MDQADALADAGFPVVESSDSRRSSHSRSVGMLVTQAVAVGGGGGGGGGVPEKEPRLHAPRLYCERWPVLLGYCALIIGGQITFVLTIPIADEMAAFYGVNARLIDAAALAYVVSFAPAMAWVPWALARMELYKALFLGAALTCIGSWLAVGGRVASGAPFVVAGHALAAVGHPLMLNCLASVPQMWFGTHERQLATSLGYIASVVGVGGGIMLAVALAPGPSSVPSALLASAGIVTSLLFGFVLLFRRRPWSPPTGSAATQLEDDRLRAGRTWAPPPLTPLPASTCASLSATARDLRWATCAVSYSLVAGTVLAWARVGGRLMHAAGHGDAFTAGLGVLFVCAGILGTIVSSLVVGFMFAFKRVLGALGAAAAMSACLFAWQVEPDMGMDSEAALNVLVCCVGFSLMPLAPIALELCAETAYPLREYTTTGALQLPRVCTGHARSCGVHVRACGRVLACWCARVSVSIRQARARACASAYVCMFT
jgi:hypothetical protein